MPQQQLSAELLSAVNTGFNARFRDGMQRGRVPPGLGQSMAAYLVKFAELAMNVPSTGEREVHTWVSQMPGFSIWVGERVASTLAVNGLLVTNDDYHETVEIDRNKILDDAIGAYGGVFEAMGAESADDAFWLDLCIAGLIDETIAWGDGLAFFHATRKFGDETINNVVDGELTQTNLQLAVSRMMAFKGNKGKPLNAIPFMVICGATAFWKAKKWLENETVTDDAGESVTNETRGIAVPRWHFGLPANAWYLVGFKSTFRPVCAQRRQEASNLVSNVNPTDPNVFYLKKYVYGTDLRGAAFRPLPFLIVRGSNGIPPGATKKA